MKKLTCFVMALALVLGLTQCKKEKIEPQSEGNTVRITLNVGGGASTPSTGSGTEGSRVNVNPNAASQITFEDGDQILVASGGKYVGTLTRTDGTFSGNITDPVEGQPLYFYFLGNKQGTLSTGATTCTVNISDQSNYPHLPVISMGRSVNNTTDNVIVNYEAGVTSYTARLYNKCSLMKFVVTTPSDSPICITGMNNEVTVHFDNPTDSGFSYGKADEDGIIKMAGGSGTKWVIVLPQPALETVEAYSDDGYYCYDYQTTEHDNITIPEIEANRYYDDGINLPVDEATLVDYPLTFEAITPGTEVSVYCPAGISLQYSTDGFNWQPYTSNDPITLTDDEPWVSFRGNNVTMSTGTEYSKCTRFICSEDCYVYGSVMSLLYPSGNASEATSFPEGSTCTFAYLFSEGQSSESILLHSNPTPEEELLLPATTLTPNCYYRMFSDTEIEEAPMLPATTMAESCYREMFYQCRKLKTGPEMTIEATADYCCQMMFYGCNALTSISSIHLSAPIMAEGCYQYMFKMDDIYVSDLTSIPQDFLPATTLAKACYESMFERCKKLTNVPDLPATTLAEACYHEMFYGCSALTSVPQNLLPATTLAPSCYDGMFRSSGITQAPNLPAPVLVKNCYGHMFAGCSHLNSVTCLATSGIHTEIEGNYSTFLWLQDAGNQASGTKTFYKASSVPVGSGTSGQYWPTNESGVPSGWTVVNAPQ
jgi:hypothetical protein